MMKGFRRKTTITTKQGGAALFVVVQTKKMCSCSVITATIPTILTALMSTGFPKENGSVQTVCTSQIVIHPEVSQRQEAEHGRHQEADESEDSRDAGLPNKSSGTGHGLE